MLDPSEVVKIWEPRLWATANSVVAFVLAQSLVSGYQLGQESFRANFRDRRSAVLALFLLALVTIGEVSLMLDCKRQAIVLLSAENAATLPIQVGIWSRSTCWRIAAILFFALAPFFGILGAWLRSRPDDERT